MGSSGEHTVVWVPDPDPIRPRIAGLDGVELHRWGGEPTPGPEAERVEYVVLPIGAPTAWEVLARLPRLRTVQLLSAGYEAAVGRLPAGVALSNGRGIHDPAVAEWVLTVTLASLRSLPEYGRRRRERVWEGAMSASLFGATVLIVGHGSIGHAVERLMEPFGPRMLRIARTAHDGAAAVSKLPELIGQADVVVVLLPDTPQTRGLLDREMLARMKTGALLVNAGRGSAVVGEALLAELTAGRLHAALDVTQTEPLPADDPLWSAPGLILTPHVASNAAGKDGRIADFVAGQLRRLAAGEPPENLVEL